ncbi:glycosyltransferase [Acidobacteriota bacterium]
MNKAEKIKYFDSMAEERDKWRARNRYYYSQLEKLLQFIIPPQSSVLQIGCGTGDLLAKLNPSHGVGIDFSHEMITRAKKKHPDLSFKQDDAEDLDLTEKFDYIILSDIIGHLYDVFQAFHELHKVSRTESRIIITHYNYLWEPILKLSEKLRFKMKEGHQNWLSLPDIENLLLVNGFEIIRSDNRLLFPKYIPLFSTLINKYIAKLPLIRKLCLVQYVVARPTDSKFTESIEKYSCSVVVPCRNEKGNIEDAVLRTPKMGEKQEIIFVDGASTDGTIEEIERVIAKYGVEKDIKLIHQGGGKGKGDAVRKGFADAQGDILMILDSDLTVPPEDLPKFYKALAANHGEFINGTRLVYPMEKQAMRTLNVIGNKIFSWIFTWLLGQRIKDTLCGTKVLFRKDYLRIAAGRHFFGDFDPFGDFDLLFGAAKLNLKIVEIPIRYRARVYGDIKIDRFRHGWLLLKMCTVALKKIKLS